jgi:hypothetical protein
MNTTIRRAAWRAGLILLLGLLISPVAWARLSFEDVVRLISAGVSEETILSLADVEGATFDLTVEQVIELKGAGASEGFIRALMGKSEGNASSGAYGTPEDEGSVGSAYSDYGLDDYATVFSEYYYDPFAYYWYAWPDYYAYYSPFWWSYAGFYYGGAWCWDWWYPWGPCTSYCNYNYGCDYWYGYSDNPSYGERDWQRARSAPADRVEREQAVRQRAGLAGPAGQTSRTSAAYRDGTRGRTQAANATGRGQRTIRTGSRTRLVRGESPSSSRQAYRNRSADRQRPVTERGIQRGRSSAPQRQSSTRSSGGARGWGTTHSGGSGRGMASRPATGSRSGGSYGGGHAGGSRGR